MHTPRFLCSLLSLSVLGCAASAPPTAESPTPANAPSKLTLEVITASPEGFLVNSTLVSGPTSAVLIDAQFTLADAKAVVGHLKALQKPLTTVYVTHFHPDHYFGFVALKEAYPEAKLVALPETVAEIEKTWQEKLATWKPLYKDAIPDQPIVPEALTSNSIDLDGEKLEIVGGLQGDAAGNSYVWIPSLSTVVVGDIVYDQVFPWTAETSPDARVAWSGTLDKIAALGAKTVVPGHQKPERKQDPSNVQFTQGYLKAYDAALASSKTPEELQAKVKAQYPDAALDVILKLGSEASLSAPKTATK